MYIPVSALKALACFSSTENARYYLHGVHVVVSETHIVMEATDGNAGAAIRYKRDRESDADAFIGAFILHRDTIAAIKLPRGMAMVELKVELPRVTVVDPATGCGRSDLVIDGTFPHLARVCPQSASGEAAEYNLEVLAMFTAARKVLGIKSRDKGGCAGTVRIAMNGSSAALVNWVPADAGFEGYGVAMPYAFKPTGMPKIESKPDWHV